MKLIVDSNVLFSSLIKDGKTAELLLDFSLNLYSPEFIFQEFEKHKNEILEKTRRTEQEFNEILDILKTIIKIVDKKDIEPFFKKAKELSPDPDDYMYFALALKLNCPIWSNDKRLKHQNIVRIYSTEDLVKEL